MTTCEVMTMTTKAADATDAAADDLRRAVAEARTDGEGWGTIGMVLGVTRQSAQQRFRDVEV